MGAVEAKQEYPLGADGRIKRVCPGVLQSELDGFRPIIAPSGLLKYGKGFKDGVSDSIIQSLKSPQVYT